MSVEGANFPAAPEIPVPWAGQGLTMGIALNAHGPRGPWRVGSGGQAGTSCSNTEARGWASPTQAGVQRWTGQAGFVKRTGQG